MYNVLRQNSIPSVSQLCSSLCAVRQDGMLDCLFVCLYVGCLTPLQHASVSRGRICSEKFTCYHTEKKVADQTFYLTQSLYTDTGPTSPIADPITSGTLQGSHLSAMNRPGKTAMAQAGTDSWIFRSRGGRLNR